MDERLARSLLTAASLEMTLPKIVVFLCIEVGATDADLRRTVGRRGLVPLSSLLQANGEAEALDYIGPVAGGCCRRTLVSTLGISPKSHNVDDARACPVRPEIFTDYPTAKVHIG